MIKFVSELPPKNVKSEPAVPSADIVSTLAQRPGEWAEVRSFPVSSRNYANHYASYLKGSKGTKSPVKAGVLDACTRTSGGNVLVFARYVAKVKAKKA